MTWIIYSQNPFKILQKCYTKKIAKKDINNYDDACLDKVDVMKLDQWKLLKILSSS